jgi:hypothetical protein
MPPKRSTEESRKEARSENPSQPPVEFKSAEENIFRTLNKHRLGDFKVMYVDMTFEWSDRPNRAVSSPEKMSQLYDSMARGLHRIDPQHRMTGIIDRALLTDCVKIIDDKGQLCDVTLEEISELNKDVIYPTVVFVGSKAGGKRRLIEMQSGQHRMACLTMLYADPAEHYWIVTLYDKSMIQTW